MRLNELTIQEAREKLDSKEISAVELTAACLAEIKKRNKEINACLTVCADEALAEAKVADSRIKKGEKESLLGIPYIVKDNILTRGVRATAGSKILENYIAPYDATVVAKLRAAGAVLLGKGNLDEFGHGASGENSAFGPTKNPRDLARVSGGSSSGPAAAVAANFCLFAIGTDTGGSIRCPASFCGVVGLKPTYGRSSRFGLMAMTSSTDVPGPIAKTAIDAAMILGVMAGEDRQDATTVPEKVPDYLKNINQKIKGLKIGWPEDFVKGASAGVLELITKAQDKLVELGAEIVPIALPHAKYGIPVYYIITPSEISSNLARFDGVRYGFSSQEARDVSESYKLSRGQGFGAEAKRRIMLGTYVLSAGYYDAYYLQAQKVRTKIKEELDAELSKLDAIILPTQPDVAYKIGEQSDDPLKMYLEDIFLSPASLAGLPAISVPCGEAGGLPVGMQLIGKRFNEETILRIGHNFLNHS